MIVTPGEQVGVEEEYTPMDFVYPHDGKLLAALVGVLQADRRNHVVSVRPIKERELPKKGDELVCSAVAHIGSRVGLLRCFAVSKGSRLKITKPVTALLPIHQLGDYGANAVYEAVGIGDYVLAKVVSSRGPPYTVSTRGLPYGVIYSLCPNCRRALVKRGGALYCAHCGVNVKRKISIHYLVS